MPFWGKKRSSDDPQATPKLASIALPDERAIRRSTSRIPGQWSAELVSKSKSTEPGIARSRTPHPALSKPLRDAVPISRPRTASLTKTGPIRGILKTSKPMEKNDDKEATQPSKVKGSHETTQSQATRGRTSSLTNGAVKGILKRRKPLIEDDFDKPVASMLPNKRGGSPDLIEDPLAYRKSVMKGGGHSYPSTKEKDQENTFPAAYPERYGQAPPHFYQASPIAPQPIKPTISRREEYQQGSAHPRMSSKLYQSKAGIATEEYFSEPEMQRSSHLTRSRNALTPLSSAHQAPTYAARPTMYPVERVGHHQGSAYPSQAGHDMPRYDHLQALEQHHRQGVSGQAPPNPRYVKPVVRKVPQKEEEISLSWPFIDPAGKSDKHQRQRYPKLFYDVGMNPWADRVGVRAYLPGCVYTRQLLDEELYLPVSSHCVLRRMTIMCEYMERWPVVAERAEGLRCIDVFDAIHRTFAVPLTAEEKSSYTREFLESCIPAFKQRCTDGPGITAHNEAKGLCRVDVLRTKKIFRGIEKKSKHSAWILTLDRPQGPTTF